MLLISLLDPKYLYDNYRIPETGIFSIAEPGIVLFNSRDVVLPLSFGYAQPVA